MQENGHSHLGVVIGTLGVLFEVESQPLVLSLWMLLSGCIVAFAHRCRSTDQTR